jgi:hypothetical protein
MENVNVGADSYLLLRIEMFLVKFGCIRLEFPVGKVTTGFPKHFMTFRKVREDGDGSTQKREPRPISSPS